MTRQRPSGPAQRTRISPTANTSQRFKPRWSRSRLKMNDRAASSSGVRARPIKRDCGWERRSLDRATTRWRRNAPPGEGSSVRPSIRSRQLTEENPGENRRRARPVHCTREGGDGCPPLAASGADQILANVARQGDRKRRSASSRCLRRPHRGSMMPCAARGARVVDWTPAPRLRTRSLIVLRVGKPVAGRQGSPRCLLIMQPPRPRTPSVEGRADRQRRVAHARPPRR